MQLEADRLKHLAALRAAAAIAQAVWEFKLNQQSTTT